MCRAEKPDPAIFRAALERLRRGAKNDGVRRRFMRRDREGARRAGLGFIWIAPQDVRDAEARAAAELPADAAISALGELREGPDMTAQLSADLFTWGHHRRGPREPPAGRWVPPQQTDGGGRRTAPYRPHNRSLPRGGNSPIDRHYQ